MTSVILTTYHVEKGVPTGERNTHDVTPALDSYHLDRVKLLSEPSAFIRVVEDLQEAGLADTAFDNYTYEVYGWTQYVAEREAAGEFGPVASLSATPEVIRRRIAALFDDFRDNVPVVTLVSGPKDGVARQRVSKAIGTLKASYESLVTEEQDAVHALDKEWMAKLFAAPVANGDYHPKKHPEILLLVAQFYDYLHNRAHLFEEALAAEALARYRTKF